MATLIDQLPALDDYGPSLLILGALALTVLVQSFLAAPLAFVSEEQVPGMPLRHDHSRISFRALRTHANSAESLPAFGWALLVAVAAGVEPVVVNGLAGAHFACRMAFWAIYYSGVGKVAGGPRTLAFVGGLLSNVALAVSGIWALAL